MKLIHAADIHLGSKIDKAITSDKRKDLQIAIRDSFYRMVEYAKNNDIKVILLSGDVFDSDSPSLKDKKFFYDTIRENKSINFYYLKGNHDKSDLHIDNVPVNLITFDKSWSTFVEGNVRISAIELARENQTSLYSTLSLNDDKFNIVMLHGSINGDVKSENYIDISKLANKNINYLALGHIHKRSEGTKYGISFCYPGCLQGRSFDESGEHGFVVLDIEINKFSSTFVPISQKVLEDVSVDISYLSSCNQIADKIKENVKQDNKVLYRVNLTGKIHEETFIDLSEIETILSSNYFFIKLIDKTKLDIDYEKYKNDPSVKGEFIRLVENDEKLSDEKKREIILLGLNALKGELE